MVRSIRSNSAIDLLNSLLYWIRSSSSIFWTYCINFLSRGLICSLRIQPTFSWKSLNVIFLYFGVRHNPTLFSSNSGISGISMLELFEPFLLCLELLILDYYSISSSLVVLVSGYPLEMIILSSLTLCFDENSSSGSGRSRGTDGSFFFLKLIFDTSLSSRSGKTSSSLNSIFSGSVVIVLLRDRSDLLCIELPNSGSSYCSFWAFGE